MVLNPALCNRGYTFLLEKIQQQEMIRGTDTIWPADNSDINPFDYHFWSAAQSTICLQTPESVEDLVKCVRDYAASYDTEAMRRKSLRNRVCSVLYIVISTNKLYKKLECFHPKAFKDKMWLIEKTQMKESHCMAPWKPTSYLSRYLFSHSAHISFPSVWAVTCLVERKPKQMILTNFWLIMH